MTEASASTGSGRALRPEPDRGQIRVWDVFVRLFHWSLVGLFIFAYLTGDEWDNAHEIAGYGIMALIAARIIWGFVGSEHARFSSFVFRPSHDIRFPEGQCLSQGKALHRPQSGWRRHGDCAVDRNHGDQSSRAIMMTTDMFWGVGWVEELHEIAVNATLVLIALHIRGVLLASLEHGENLVRSMITGMKRR